MARRLAKPKASLTRFLLLSGCPPGPTKYLPAFRSQASVFPYSLASTSLSLSDAPSGFWNRMLACLEKSAQSKLLGAETRISLSVESAMDAAPVGT